MKLHLALIAALSLGAVLLTPPVQAAAPSIGGCSVFPTDHVWNTPIDTLPLDANSSSIISTIGSAGLKADFGAGLWDGGPIGIPFVTVPASQQKYPVTFDYDDESDPGPYASPLNAPIEGGPNSDGDRHVISVETGSCTLYELYYSFPQAASWQAGSGAVYDLQSYALRPAGWTSADAAGLPIFPGLVRYDEVASGEITHAIRFTLPNTRNTYIWPARHKASSLTGTQYAPMGMRFRLKANFDISGYSASNQVILKALKKYGMILADNGSAMYMSGAPDERWNNSDLNSLRNVLASSFEAIDESSLMISVNSGQARQTSGGSATSTPVPPTATRTNTPVPPTATRTNTPMPPTATRTNTPVGSTPTRTATATATRTATPSPVTVNVSPGLNALRPNQNQQFTATVQNATDTSVVWTVNGIVGGNSTMGTITTGGLYKAPSSIPQPATVTITATSVQAPTKSDSATAIIFNRRWF